MRNRFVLAGMAAAVVGGSIVGLVASTRIVVALAAVAALVAAAAALLALRVTMAITRELDRRIGALQQAQRRQLRLGREAVEVSRRTMRRAQKHRQDLGASQRQTAAKVAGMAAQLTAIRRDLRPPVEVKVLTGDDLTTPGGLALSGLAFDGDRPHLVLLMQALAPRFVFAGIRTAVVAAAETAHQLGLPLRIVVFEPTGETADDTHRLVRDVLTEAGYPDLAATLRLSLDDARDSSGHHADDVWFATLWATAYAVRGLVDAGLVRRERVVYLIQDWEPNFYPWGDLYARAESTYRSGFHTLINSMSLSRYVADQTGTPLDPTTVFAPEVDRDALATAAAGWTPGPEGVVRVLFYARPASARNMFNLGAQSLRLWAEEYADGFRPLVRMAGAPIAAADLGPAIDVELLGKTSYDEYYDQLQSADIGLALMNSPHPSHLSLELPMAGIPTVTNRFGDYRDSWAEDLVLGDPHPRSLALALKQATDLAHGRKSHEAHLELRDLGGSLAAAVSAVVVRLR